MSILMVDDEQLPERIALYLKEQIQARFFGMVMDNRTRATIKVFLQQELYNLGYNHFVPEDGLDDPLAQNLGILILKFRKQS